MRSYKTAGSKTSGTTPAIGNGADTDATTGSGRSGEGADSALEAMLKKRHTGVDNPPDPDAARTSQQPDGNKTTRE